MECEKNLNDSDYGLPESFENLSESEIANVRRLSLAIIRSLPEKERKILSFALGYGYGEGYAKGWNDCVRTDCDWGAKLH